MTLETPEYLQAARQFGAEVIANGGGSRYPNREERDDIASYYGVDSWAAMPEDARKQALDAWHAGIKAEESYRI